MKYLPLDVKQQSINTRIFKTHTVFTSPNGTSLICLVSERFTKIFSTSKKSSTSSSAQTQSNSLAFNHFEMADIYAHSEVEKKMRKHLTLGRQLSMSSKGAKAN